MKNSEQTQILNQVIQTLCNIEVKGVYCAALADSIQKLSMILEVVKEKAVEDYKNGAIERSTSDDTPGE